MSAESLKLAVTRRGLYACGLNENFMTGMFKKIEPIPSSRLLCANLGVPACTNTGTLACAKCMLVKYCGKACQIAHWPKHRQDCGHPQLKANWQPAWVTENRIPAFVGPGGGPPVVQFGYKANHSPTYVWGNVTAIDCLNVARNEGSAARTADFKLCFAASGDIRNLVQTINRLPSDYSGKCDILFNDKSPIVANRNWIILHTLLEPTVPIPGAADLAAHFMYSAALSPVACAHLNICIAFLYGRGIIQDGKMFAMERLPMRGGGELYMMAMTEEMKDFLRMPLSTYRFEDAMKNMRSATLHPSRVDYRDRRLASLTPGHRMAWTHYQRTGVLGPYSADTMNLTEPNRLLFTADGEWLTLDSANPLQGWDVSAVLASGKRHGINPQDIYGCLFFHVKDEFEEFARRVERFNINIHLTQFDAGMVPKLITQDLIKPFSSGCFDRIETSNLADYIGAADIIDCWAPLLNRHNKHATLFMYFMNWHTSQPGAHFEDPGAGNVQKSPDVMEKTATALEIDMRALYSGRMGMNSVPLLRIMAHVDTFFDNSAPFEKFLRDNAESKARSCGLRVRKRNNIHTRRFGIPLSKQQNKVPEVTPEEFYNIYVLGGADGPVRFVEFETCP